jgi:hypothetical protein
VLEKGKLSLLFPLPRVTQMVFSKEFRLAGVIDVERTVRRGKSFLFEGYCTLKSARQQPMTAVNVHAGFN